MYAVSCEAGKHNEVNSVLKPIELLVKTAVSMDRSINNAPGPRWNPVGSW